MDITQFVVDISEYEPADQMKVLNWSAQKSDENYEMMLAFEAAAAPIVDRLNDWALRPGARFDVCSKIWTSSRPNTFPHQFTYTIRAYGRDDHEGGKRTTEGKPRESFGFEINFHQNGKVEVLKYYNDKDENGLAPSRRRTETIVKTSLRQHNFGWLNLGKIMPEKIDDMEVGLSYAVKDALVSAKLFDELKL